MAPSHRLMSIKFTAGMVTIETKLNLPEIRPVDAMEAGAVRQAEFSWRLAREKSTSQRRRKATGGHTADHVGRHQAPRRVAWVLLVTAAALQSSRRTASGCSKWSGALSRHAGDAREMRSQQDRFGRMRIRRVTTRRDGGADKHARPRQASRCAVHHSGRAPRSRSSTC